MAWMKSATSGNFFLTGEFSSEAIPVADASGVSQALGFNSVVVPSEVILAEQARAVARRAALIAEIVAGVVAAIGSGTGAGDSAVVDEEEFTSGLTSFANIINQHTTDTVAALTLSAQS